MKIKCEMKVLILSSFAMNHQSDKGVLSANLFTTEQSPPPHPHHKMLSSLPSVPDPSTKNEKSLYKISEGDSSEPCGEWLKWKRLFLSIKVFSGAVFLWLKTPLNYLNPDKIMIRLSWQELSVTFQKFAPVTDFTVCNKNELRRAVWCLVGLFFIFFIW